MSSNVLAKSVTAGLSLNFLYNWIATTHRMLLLRKIRFILIWFILRPDEGISYEDDEVIKNKY